MIATILEAAERVMVRVGYESFTTNHVAEEAGISVGSVYQYFPDKHVLVAHMVSEQIQQIAAGAIASMLARSEPLTLREFAVSFLKEQIDRSLERAGLLTAMRTLVEELELSQRIEDDLLRASEAFLEANDIQIRQPRRGHAARMAIQCILDQVNRFIASPTRALSSQQFAEMLAGLVLGFLVENPDQPLPPRR
ncbi:MAG TPA: helix-turn-helix domain-containing protein [Nevskiaceae bacterium]|nr:helix-turn-helix domain-containing protein [Nevskiaceae bacterium]